MSKKDFDELRRLEKDGAKLTDDLELMLTDSEAYFKKHPIKEDWPNPPKIPTKEALDEAMNKNTHISKQIEVYSIVSKATHHKKRGSEKQLNYEYVTDWQKHRELEEIIAEKLRAAGYLVRTQSNVSSWNSYGDKLNVLHSGFGEFNLSEIPKITENNPDITSYLIDEFGKIRSYKELIAAYQKDKAPEPTDFDELTEDLDETQTKMIKEFLESEELEASDLSSINERDELLEIDIYSRQYEMMESDAKAERLAFDQIDDDDEMKYFYTEQIKSEKIDPVYTSFSDWLQQVKDDGWANQLCRYDGENQETKSGFVYWRSN